MTSPAKQTALKPAAAAASSGPHFGVLQRKCACGGSAGAEGECQECKQNGMTLQRRASGGSAPATAPTIVHEVLRSPGQPLDRATRAFLEPRFGHDFGRVRVHADARAAASARAVNALAYTVGRDVVFGAGQFNPGTTDGRRLLAHELAHVVQQGGGIAGLQWSQLAISSPSDAAEVEAHFVANRAIDDGTPAVPPRSIGLRVARMLQRSECEPAASPAPDPVVHSSYVSGSDSVLNLIPLQNLVRTLKSGDKRPLEIHGFSSSQEESRKPGLACTRAVSIRYFFRKGAGVVNDISLFEHPATADVDARGQIQGATIHMKSAGLAGAAAATTTTPATPAPTPATTEERTRHEARRGALKHAAQVSAGIATPEKYRQLRCVILRGGCPQSRDGGTAEADIKTYNEKCKEENKTGYTGDDVSPTPDQCAELKPGTLEFASPSRLKQLQSLLQEYAALVRAGALRADEILGIDSAIQQAEETLGRLGPGEPRKAQDNPPWVIARRDGGPVPVLAGATLLLPRAAFSTAAAGTGTVGFVAALAAIGLLCIAYLINGYQLRKEGDGAVETLIGIIASLLRSLSDEAIEKRLREEEKTKGKDEPQPRPRPTTDPPPIPPSRCPFPTGLSREDSIPLVWNKVREDDYYPKSINVAGTQFDRDDPANPKTLPHGEPLGVPERFWPRPGKKFQLLSTERGPEAGRFRAVLKRYGVDLSGLEADHVQDLQWSGPDSFHNLWPMDASANKSAGPRQNNTQAVSFCVIRNGPAKAGTTLGQMKAEGHWGRWFHISRVER